MRVKKRLPRKLKKRLRKKGIFLRKMYLNPPIFKGVCNIGIGWEAQLLSNPVAYKSSPATIKDIEDLLICLSK